MERRIFNRPNNLPIESFTTAAILRPHSTLNQIRSWEPLRGKRASKRKARDHASSFAITRPKTVIQPTLDTLDKPHKSAMNKARADAIATMPSLTNAVIKMGRTQPGTQFHFLNTSQIS